MLICIFEGITKRPEKCMHKRTRTTQSAAARVTHSQMALVGKASRIVSQTVGMARAKYFPSLFKDPALSSTMEKKTKKNNIRLCRELGCHESVMGGGACIRFFSLLLWQNTLPKMGKEGRVSFGSQFGGKLTMAEKPPRQKQESAGHTVSTIRKKAAGRLIFPPFHAIQDSNQGKVPPHLGWVSCFSCIVTAVHRQ